MIVLHPLVLRSLLLRWRRTWLAGVDRLLATEHLQNLLGSFGTCVGWLRLRWILLRGAVYPGLLVIRLVLVGILVSSIRFIGVGVIRNRGRRLCNDRLLRYYGLRHRHLVAVNRLGRLICAGRRLCGSAGGFACENHAGETPRV